jgi:hypothetical protein
VWNDSLRKFSIFKEIIAVKEKMDSLEDCKKWIDLENKRKFKRLKILYNFCFIGNEMEKGEVTGVVDDEFVLVSAGYGKYKVRPESVWLDTPENQEALKVIREKNEQIVQIRKDIVQIQNNVKCLTIEMLFDE